ncbi:unknown [Enterocloster bolteae CAG:59]|nr:unknown [Enterocloster bolteae CAG:59]
MLSILGTVILISFFIFIIVGDLFLAVKWLFCHGKRNCLNTQCPIRSKCSQAGQTEEEKAIMLARIKQLLAELEQQNM